MKLHLDSNNIAFNTISAYSEVGEAPYVEVNATRYEQSLIIHPTAPLQLLNTPQFSALSEQHFAQLALLKPELVIVGTGLKQHFVHPQLTHPLIHARVGIECMDTRAACRTYNILMAEGRQVAALLVLESI